MSVFGKAFFDSIYSSCQRWLQQNGAKTPYIAWTIGMLLFITDPKKFEDKSIGVNEINSLTTLLGRCEKDIQEDAPDLWEELDRIATTYAIYSMEDADDFIPKLTQPDDSNKNDDEGASEKAEEKKKDDKEPDDNDAETFVVTRTQHKPIAVIESDSSEAAAEIQPEHEDLTDDENCEMFYYLTDSDESDTENASTPASSASAAAPDAPTKRYRHKIILWKINPAKKQKKD